MSSDVTAIDFFCGAGGSSTGLVNAGIRVTGAVNHWKLAIETHNTNHPSTEHYQDDLQETHPKWYPRADIAWFSPGCENHSLAKGKRRKNLGQLDLWGEHKIDPAEEKSRATMREVVEFAAYHKYEFVIVENVVDVRSWQHYDSWLNAMLNLGYDHRILYLNAQFFGVPQSRDRFYAVFWKRRNRAPNLDFSPTATCPKHGEIAAVQSWKKEFHWGRYGHRRQYVYRCPKCGAEVKPGHVPAASVIDWSIPSQRIGDRKKPLKPRTMERIKAGLRKFGRQVHVPRSGAHVPRSVDPFLTSQHDGRNPLRALDEPLWCVTGMNNEQQLVVPPFLINQRCTDTSSGIANPIALDEPLRSIVTVAQHVLITPLFLAVLKHSYSPDGSYLLPPLPLDQPMPTQRTVSHQALVEVEDLLPECGFRMLEPEELKLGMSFPDEYVILGNKHEQVRQIGHAVACNVAEWIGRQCVESLR